MVENGETSILVYQLGAPPVEIPRSQCLFTQRSALVTTCPRERFNGYHRGGRGVEGGLRPDELELGSAVHLGMEKLLGGTEPRLAGLEAEEYFSSKNGKLLVGENPFLEEQSPEMYLELLIEQGMLANGLVQAFARRHLANFLRTYEVLALEEEVAWKVGVLADGRWLVMLTRYDGVVRGKADGRLRVLSHKTLKRIYEDTIEKLGIDPQQWTEGLAVQARYGEAPVGTLYTYLVKGDRRADSNGFKRYESPLVRPWMNLQAFGGTPKPTDFAVVGKWSGVDGSKGGSLGKGWERVNIWDYVPLDDWIGWLAGGYVQGDRGRDWLAEAAIEPILEPWNPANAEEFQWGILRSEEQWDRDVRQALAYPDQLPILIPKRPTACYRFGTRKCRFHGTCWEGQSIESGLVSGRWRERVPNHPEEVGVGKEEERWPNDSWSR